MKKILASILIGSLCFTCEDFLGVDNISNEHVQLIAPTNEVVLNNANLTFTWNPVEGAEQYHFQIAQPSFEEALQVVRDTLVDSPNFRDTLDVNIYQWRVRAENSAYHTPYTTNTLTIEE